MVAKTKPTRTFNPGDVVYVATTRPGARGYLGWQPGSWYKGVVDRIIPAQVFPRRYGPDQVIAAQVAVVRVRESWWGAPVPFGRLGFEGHVVKNRRDVLLSEVDWIETIKPAIEDRKVKEQAMRDQRADAQRTNAERIADRIVADYLGHGGSERGLPAIIADVLLAEAKRPPGYVGGKFTYPRIQIKTEVYEYGDAD